MVEVRHDQAGYTLLDGDPLEVVHHGEPLTIEHGRPIVGAIPPAAARVRPRQPPGREPFRRRQAV